MCIRARSITIALVMKRLSIYRAPTIELSTKHVSLRFIKFLIVCSFNMHSFCERHIQFLIQLAFVRLKNSRLFLNYFIQHLSRTGLHNSVCLWFCKVRMNEITPTPTPNDTYIYTYMPLHGGTLCIPIIDVIPISILLDLLRASNNRGNVDWGRNYHKKTSCISPRQMLITWYELYELYVV